MIKIETQELFDAIKLIARNEIQKNTSTTTVIGTVVERIEASDAYSVNYQNIEILASSLGGIYKTGDSVYVMLPNGTLSGVKFIIGKANDRTPTITANSAGLSESTLAMIQDLVNSVNDLSADNKLTPSEKQSLKTQWEQIKASHDEVLGLTKSYPDIDLTDLEKYYKDLDDFLTVIFENMGTTSSIDGTALQTVVSNYLSMDGAIRIKVQEALRGEITYKADIVSTAGTSFKNGVIDTKLQVIIMRGKSIINDDIPDEKITWFKMNLDGTIMPEWIKTGKTIDITADDIEIKQVFLVKIMVQEAVVAQDTITLIDLNDIENIKLTIDAKYARTQVYSPASKTLEPNYETTNQVIGAKVLKGSSDITSLATFKWYFNDEEIVSDGRFEVKNNSLFIQRNLLSVDAPTMLIRCDATYYSDEYLTNLTDSQILDFSYVANGEDGLPSYFHSAWANSADGTLDFSIHNNGQEVEELREITTGDVTETKKTIVVYLLQSNFNALKDEDKDPAKIYEVIPSKEKDFIYMGTYSDHSESQSLDPTMYAWTKVKGDDAIAGYLTAETVGLAAGNDGVVTDFSQAKGKFIVMDGREVLTAGVVFTVFSKANIIVTMDTDGNYGVSGITGSIGSAVLRAVYKGVTIDKVFTAIKSMDGGTASNIILTADAQIISVDFDGSILPKEPFKITGLASDTAITEWSYSIDGVDSDTPPVGVAREENIVTIDPNTSTFKSLSVKASDGTIFDVVTVVRVIDGMNGVSGATIALSGDTQVITVSKSGVIIPGEKFTITATAIGTEITAWSYSVDGGEFREEAPVGVTQTGVAVVIDPSQITFKTLSIKASDGTLSDVFTIAKIVDGANGASPINLVINSSNGYQFKNNIINTTFTAILYQDNKEIDRDSTKFSYVWSKTNADGAADTAWNLAHQSSQKSITISNSDVLRRATFDCTAESLN